jgi:hypothetical protein
MRFDIVPEITEMEQAKVIEIAWIAVEPNAAQIEGLDSVRRISPEEICSEMRGKGMAWKISASFEKQRDYWAVLFKLKVPDGFSPDVICVHVDDETGIATVVQGL